MEKLFNWLFSFLLAYLLSKLLNYLIDRKNETKSLFGVFCKDRDISKYSLIKWGVILNFAQYF